MKIAHSKAEKEARIHNALVRLSSARREKLSAEDYDVFCDGLGEFDARIVEQVCDELGRIAPDEYSPRFPELHVIRARCFLVLKFEREREALKHERLLPRHRVPLVSAEKLAKFREDVAEAVARKRWPGEGE